MKEGLYNLKRNSKKATERNREDMNEMVGNEEIKNRNIPPVAFFSSSLNSSKFKNPKERNIVTPEKKSPLINFLSIFTSTILLKGRIN
jgi:hypothetical protein